MKKLIGFAACAAVVASALVLRRQDRKFVLTSDEKRTLHDAAADCTDADSAPECIRQQTQALKTSPSAAVPESDSCSETAISDNGTEGFAVACKLRDSMKRNGGDSKSGYGVAYRHGAMNYRIGDAYGDGKLVAVVGITDRLVSNISKVNPDHPDLFRMAQPSDVVIYTSDANDKNVMLSQVNSSVRTGLSYDNQNHPQAILDGLGVDPADAPTVRVLTIFSGPQKWSDIITADRYAPWIHLDGKYAYNISSQPGDEYDHYPNDNAQNPAVDRNHVGVWFNLLDGNWVGDMGDPVRKK